MPPTDRFVSEEIFPVRFAETDAMGIVHHASYVVYIEEARIYYAKARGSDYTLLVAEGYHLTVAELHTRYAAPARFGQNIAARCWIDDLKSRSITFGYEIADAEKGTIHMTGQTRHICVNLEGQVARLPDRWAARLRG